MHPACLPVEQLMAQCSVRATRRSGPGGQHRNKVETAVVVEHRPSGIIGQASERRSQSANRAEAIFRLRLKLAVEFCDPDLGEQHAPSSLWLSRSFASKLKISPDHEDFPAILAEAMAGLRSRGFSIQEVAKAKCISASQLVLLLKLHPPALAVVNEQRAAMSLRSLK